jgi:hypothetical protein
MQSKEKILFTFSAARRQFKEEMDRINRIFQDPHEVLVL